MIFSKFVQSPNKGGDAKINDPHASINFNAPKVPKLRLDILAAALDAELYEKERFVMGKINPIYFDDVFQFQDPDVKLTSVDTYKVHLVRNNLHLVACPCNHKSLSSGPNTLIHRTHKLLNINRN